MRKNLFVGNGIFLFQSRIGLKYYSQKIKKEEILLYIMQDKYSIKPDKEYRISHSIIDDDSASSLEDQNKLSSVYKNIKKSSKIVNYGRYIKLIIIGKHSIKEISTFRIKIRNYKANLRRNIIIKICPRDYPYSVKKGYSGFSKYTFISNCCFSTMNFMTTQVLINALNLNISSSVGFAFSAGMNWAIKEGLGQIGSILYITKYNEMIEKNAKSWRVFSIKLASLAFLLEATSLLLPNHFLPIAASANFIKLVSLNTNHIARTAIIENFSKNYNIVDLTNKFGIQNNISILIGNLLGFSISFIIPLNNFTATFSVICLMSIYNIYSAYKCLGYIDFIYFNFQRACLFCEEFLSLGFHHLKKKNNSITDIESEFSKSPPRLASTVSDPQNFSTQNKSLNNILSPEEISKREKVFYNNHKNVFFSNTSPDIILNLDSNSYIIGLFHIFKDKNFLVLIKKKFNPLKLKMEFKIFTFLKVNAENDDIFLAFLFTIRLSIVFNNSKNKHLMKSNYDEILDLIEDNLKIHEEIDKKFLFEKMKNLGWKLNFLYLEEKYLRYHTVHRDI